MKFSGWKIGVVLLVCGIPGLIFFAAVFLISVIKYGEITDEVFAGIVPWAIFALILCVMEIIGLIILGYIKWGTIYRAWFIKKRSQHTLQQFSESDKPFEDL